MIDWLYEYTQKRHAGAVASGVLAAMILWMWVPDAPQWFYLGGAFVVCSLLTGALLETYVRFFQTVSDEVRDGDS